MIKRSIKAFVERTSALMLHDLHDNIVLVDKGTQILLTLRYRELLRTGSPLPAFADVGFRNYSQFDEDGILLYIFALIGTTNRMAAEMCAGIGSECNTANLILSQDWHAVLFDGDPENIRKAGRFFGDHRDSMYRMPKLVSAWIDKDNVNDLLRKQGLEGEIDLFTLDMDGVDWWIWKAIDCINPRVVVVEYNNGWGAQESYTVPYRADFQWGEPRNYFGASLAAFHKLAGIKGYRLVGCNRHSNNAFFVRNDIQADVLPEVSVESCLKYNSVERLFGGLPTLENQKWEAV